MAISLVNVYSAYAPSNSVGSVVVQAGDLIVVGYSFQATTSATCSDNASGSSNTYNSATDGVAASGTACRGYIFYAVAKASETLTVTCTANTDNGISVHVVRGMNQTLGSVLDLVAVPYLSLTSVTAHSSNTILTTQADEYLFCFWFQETANATLTENGTSFTKRTEFNNHVHQTFDRIVSSIGTYQDTVTASVNSRYNALLAGFKADTGGTAYLPPDLMHQPQTQPMLAM